MIPKVVHYCWFGGNPLPKDAARYIESWKKFLPDYQIKEWNESNFDLDSNLYVRQAYDNRKFAFVTDYVRLYALYTEGGVYMDTDVEVCGSYDNFLHHKMFSGFETDKNVPTGMMAAERGSLWAKELLEGYENRTFVLENGEFDMTTNTTVITQYMLGKGLKLNNKYQDIEGLCTMYPSEYFCPKDHRTGRISCTKNTVCIHHFAGSWLNKTPMTKFKHSFKVFMARCLGDKLVSFLSDVVTLRIFRR